MILQSLNELYHRVENDPDYEVPSTGYSIQKITFCIVINQDGSLHDIEDARTTIPASGKTKVRIVPRQMAVPGENKPPGPAINPCTLWDNTAYLLGHKKPDIKNPEKTEKDRLRDLNRFNESRKHHLKLEDKVEDASFSAVCRFYELWDVDNIEERWKQKLDDFAVTGFGIFRVLPNLEYVHQSSRFSQWWDDQQKDANGNGIADDEEQNIGWCLVTGTRGSIARLHEPAIKGVNGAAPGGAKLASFNLASFESYKKHQSYNAPVSETAASQYCKVLNALLDGPKNKQHRVQVGDATTIFWTERETNIESVFSLLLSGTPNIDIIEHPTEQDQVLQQKLNSFFNVLRQGGNAPFDSLTDEQQTRFYILGLSGNRTRLAVRFWHVCTIRELVDRLCSHFKALSIQHQFDSDHEFPAVFRLLDETVRLLNGKTPDRKSISPILGGQIMQAILRGTSYPMTLYMGVLNRLRSDPVNYLKAAIIKAVLIRNFNRAIDMSLNAERTEPAYLLGRLFAALEKTQKDAIPNVKQTIRESYYSTASSTPSVVFPRILRTYQHHLAKLEGGHKVNRERLVQSIHAPLTGYPSHFSLEDQGLFAIGYYHQRNDFFSKKDTGSSD